jgi:hypothetical protein
LSVSFGFFNLPDKAGPHHLSYFKYTTGHRKNPASVTRCNYVIIVTSLETV